MEIKVKLSNLRTAPRKVRQVLDLVRGKKVSEAQAILLFTVNKSARSVLKLLNSAVATAKHDFHLDESTLVISTLTADEGPKLKRWHPMSRGRAYPIIKRSTHIALTLKEATAGDKKGKKGGKMIKPIEKETSKVVTKEVKTKSKTAKKK
jgi:large subunit ribosomal protein L22